MADAGWRRASGSGRDCSGRTGKEGYGTVWHGTEKIGRHGGVRHGGGRCEMARFSRHGKAS